MPRTAMRTIVVAHAGPLIGPKSGGSRVFLSKFAKKSTTEEMKKRENQVSESKILI
jgi:hypothetical protein